MGGQLARFMPGDGHRSLEFSTQLHDESISLALVPVWVLAARFHAQEAPFRVFRLSDPPRLVVDVQAP